MPKNLPRGEKHPMPDRKPAFSTGSDSQNLRAKAEGHTDESNSTRHTHGHHLNKLLILGYCHHQLTEQNREAVIAHASRCDKCLQAMNVIIRPEHGIQAKSYKNDRSRKCFQPPGPNQSLLPILGHRNMPHLHFCPFMPTPGSLPRPRRRRNTVSSR